VRHAAGGTTFIITFCLVLQRILAWSRGLIEHVRVSIDGSFLGEASHVTGPLYAFPWIPEVYSMEMHSLLVEVQVIFNFIL
jgi:hypothetical protein